MSLKQTVQRVGAVRLDPDDATLIDQAIDKAVEDAKAEVRSELANEVSNLVELQIQVRLLDNKLARVERTQYGIQQLLGKAAAYVGKERGKLPR